MRVGLFTREYPPLVYGGAGVHVDYLSRELAQGDRSRGALLGAAAVLMRAICTCAERSRGRRFRTAPRESSRARSKRSA